MAYQITWYRDGVVVACSGRLGFETIGEANGCLHGDRRFDSRAYQIWSLVDADLSQVTERQMAKFAAINRAAALSVPRMKVAFVADEKHTVELCEHYMRRSGGHAGKWQCQMFHSMGAAKAWVTPAASVPSPPELVASTSLA